MTEIRYKLKTAPTWDPVSLEEFKRNIRIGTQDEPDNTQDEYLQDLLDAAVEDSQVNTGRQYARATYTGYLDEYPDDDEVVIDKGPVYEISSVKYYKDEEDELTTVDEDDYQLDNTELDARLRFFEEFYPDDEKMNVVEVEFTCGYQDAASVPKSLKDAIILRATRRYLNPEDSGENFGMGAKITAAELKERPFKVQRF